MPLINSLRKTHPDAVIDVLARNRNKDIFKHNKDINQIHLYEPKQYFKLFGMFNKYDLVFDTEPYLNISALISFWLGKQAIGFSNQIRSVLYDHVVAHKKDQHMVENYLSMARIIGIKTNYAKLIPVESSAEDKKIATDFLKNIKERKAGLCIGTAESASKTRVWQNEKWAELADKLSDQGYTVFFMGAKSEEASINQVINLMKKNALNIAGKFNILQTAEIMRNFDLFISIDTGPMHLAAAQGVKTIGLFGPNTPTLWAPYGKENISIYKNLPCSPCIINDKGCMPDCLRKKDRYACMKLITVEEITKLIK
ncbi:glycosyltransferase family 9 protein [Candidatus Woesearchaeota archaeon]|nr:glycosyltransferase family 9 protein [Candidatus Woesearchaeota archaeon]